MLGGKRTLETIFCKWLLLGVAHIGNIYYLGSRNPVVYSPVLVGWAMQNIAYMALFTVYELKYSVEYSAFKAVCCYFCLFACMPTNWHRNKHTSACVYSVITAFLPLPSWNKMVDLLNDVNRPNKVCLSAT